MDAVIDLRKPGLRVMKDSDIHHLLEPGELGALLEWKVWDPKTGKVTEHKIKRSESYVQQFLQLLYVQMAYSPSSAPVNVRDTGNTLRAVFCYSAGGASNTYLFDVLAGATVVTLGIITGTGTGGGGFTAPTITDYKIETLVPHATMNYGAVTFGAPTSDATTSQLTISRNFANVSGGNVIVSEIALYCRAWYNSAQGNFMIIRDGIVGGITVPNGQTLTVNYRPQAVV